MESITLYHSPYTRIHKGSGTHIIITNLQYGDMRYSDIIELGKRLGKPQLYDKQSLHMLLRRLETTKLICRKKRGLYSITNNGNNAVHILDNNNIWRLDYDIKESTT